MGVLYAAWAVIGVLLCGAVWFCVLRRTRQTSSSLGIVLGAAALLAAGVAFIPSPASAVVAPTGNGFTITPGDLSFILRQIKISEAHVQTLTPTNPCGTLVGDGPNQIPDRLTSFGLRTVDGSCNNLFPSRETLGAADVPFPRYTSKVFRSAEGAPAGFPTPQATSTYAQKKGNVFDTAPRTISNLIVDQTSTNPAAVRAAGFPVRTQGNDASSFPCSTDPGPTDPPTSGLPAGCTPSHKTLFIANVTTDVGLSPPYNSLFTFFGQFFDHGVDQTVKSGGTVFVPLKADDPLITLGPDGRTDTGDEVTDPNLQFMVLTRAQNQPGNDGVLGDRAPTIGAVQCTAANTPANCDESIDDVQDANNTDSPWVDQSQTYTSHSSHQAFLREYVMNAANRPVATGKLLGGTGNGASGMATWASVKAQAATKLGLRLRDTDVLNIPMLAADPYGKFIPGPLRGLPQYVTDTGLVEGNLAGGGLLPPANVKHFDTPFLTDIAHNADPGSAGPCTATNVPAGCKSPDADNAASADFAAQAPGTYDNEMLDAHFCAGDGRVNENIALTTVHQVFHSEHDRLVDNIKGILTADATTTASGAAALPEWKVPTATNPDGWNGERLFQAARFITEMEYQHLVFEEFARKVQPDVRPFAVGNYSPDLNPAIPAEFAHAVYRFGHSMLDDDVARRNENGSDNSVPLLTGFLNPPEFFNNGANPDYTPEQAAGAVVMGSVDQTGNELDEFVTETLRNNLLGLPLDLPTLNMARARDAGIPPLNQLRRDIFGQTNDGQLAPYTSWADFGQHLKHPESLVNFVAAYGTHPKITGQSTLAGKRRAAQSIVDPIAGPVDLIDQPPADRNQFMFSTAPYANTGAGVTTTGMDDVDLWVGGLAEITNVFGGLLGTTFNYVFQSTLENLQDGDRLYYLNRTPGMNLRTQLEGNSFAELIQRNTDGTNTLKADVFATADCKFQLATLDGTANGFTADGATVADDPATDCDETALLLRKPDGTIQYKAVNSVDPSGINGQAVYNGTASVDRVVGGNDNDTFWGGPGNDIIDGNGGDDVALGGDGNDVMTDIGGADVTKGGPGNDAIDSGLGLDISMGGDGQDFMNGGANDNETFGGPGNDFIIAGLGEDGVFGDSGDDWIQGGPGADTLEGDHGAFFLDDPAAPTPGNDVFLGQAGTNDYDTEGGDDIMSISAESTEKNLGLGGFDWVIHQHETSTVGADDDMNLNALAPGLPLPVIVNRDRWLETEAASGAGRNDILRGDDAVPSTVGAGGFTGCNALDQTGLNRIPGLDAIVPPLTGNSDTDVARIPGRTCPLTGPFWGAGNILLGGGGSDLLEGRGGDDLIDGDKELRIRISVRSGVDAQGNPTATEIGSTDLMEKTYLPGGGGPTLQAAVFAGTVDPGSLVIMREITTPASPGSLDTAVFTGPRANYTITPANLTSPITVVDNVGTDGTDILTGIEKLQFSDITLSIVPSGTLTPASLTFGSQNVGTQSAAQTVTLTNGGQQNLVMTNIAIAGTNPGDFNRPAAVAGNCANNTNLATNASCTIPVRFLPTANGTRTAIVRITNNNNGVAGTFQDIPLTGTGISPQPIAGITPASLTFAPTNVGQNTAAQTVTLRNTGAGVLTVTSVATTGEFNRVAGGTCSATVPFTVAANTGQCTVQVRFSPVNAGPPTAKAGTLVFTDNSGNVAGSTQTATLSGTAVAVNGVANVTPATQAFGAQQIGIASAPRTTTVTNSGAGPLTFASIAIVNGTSTEFSRPAGAAGGTCSTATPLAAGGSCTVNTVVTPTTASAATAKTATLRFTDNSSGVVGSVQNVNLTAGGVVSAISVNPTSLAFGNNGLILGALGVNRTVTVTSSGVAGSQLVFPAGAVTIINPVPTGQYTIQANTCTGSTRAAGTTCSITVHFRATATGAKTAQLRIASNAPSSPTILNMTGNGTAL
jgi:Ca2+-binding RTX toxin-like protein